MNIVIIYWSKSGNTEKVALAMEGGFREAGANVTCKRVEDIEDVDFYAFNLVCIGFPSYQWRVPKPMDDFIKSKFNAYRNQGHVKEGAPKLPGKNALIFCTYSGPHTGMREAVPPVLYAGQFFEHLGFTIAGEWYVVGEFHGSPEASTKGCLGDIRGRPNRDDLLKVRNDAIQMVSQLEKPQL